MEHERLKLSKPHFLDAEEDISSTVKLTLSQGLNDDAVISFRLPADPERHTDLNSVRLRVSMKITKADGTDLNMPAALPAPPADGAPAPPAPAAVDHVCLEAGGMHSLFKSCDVYLNEHHASSMIAYPYTTALLRYLGCSINVRNEWSLLDDSYEWDAAKSNLEAAQAPQWMDNRRNRQAYNYEMNGRIFSDILMSSRQLLPPGVSLRIDLRRAPDHFSLVSNDTNGQYRIHINYVYLLAKRLKLRPSLLPMVRESLRSNNCFLTFNRLDTYSITIPQGSRVYRWLNCLNGAPMPNRLYVGFVAQSSVHGNLTQACTYFENLNIVSLNFKLNGRDLLVEPILCHIRKNAQNETQDRTDLTRPFLGLLEIFGHVTDMMLPPRLRYTTYQKGATLFGIELGKCGEKPGTTGSLDLEVFPLLLLILL